MVAPSRSMASSLVCGALSMTSTLQATPARRAASATPWAAFPALTVQTPCARSVGGRRATAFWAPLILNEPIGWSVSSLRYSSGPSVVGRRTSGVRTAAW